MLHGLAVLLLLAAGAGLESLGPVPAGTLRAYLVRHGQAFSNLDPTPDLPPERLDRLTELGRSQAQAAGRALRGRGVTLVVSSPAGRARESAEEICQALGAVESVVDRRLRPLDLGRGASGKPLDWDARIAQWQAGRDAPPPRGESLEQLGRRVLELVRSLHAVRAGGSVVLVAHSEVLAAFVGLLRGTPPARRYPFGIGLGSITVLEAAQAPLPRLLLLSHVPEPAP